MPAQLRRNCVVNAVLFFCDDVRCGPPVLDTLLPGQCLRREAPPQISRDLIAREQAPLVACGHNGADHPGARAHLPADELQNRSDSKGQGRSPARKAPRAGEPPGRAGKGKAAPAPGRPSRRGEGLPGSPPGSSLMRPGRPGKALGSPDHSAELSSRSACPAAQAEELRAVAAPLAASPPRHLRYDARRPRAPLARASALLSPRVAAPAAARARSRRFRSRCRSRRRCSAAGSGARSSR